jgi:N-acetylneuraminate synthase/N,N'-diacetyllegionaminate synthase
MPNLNAALGLAQVEQLEGFLARKRAIVERYSRGLEGTAGVSLLRESPWAWSSCWLATLLVEPEVYGRTAAELGESLRARGIESRRVWPPVQEQAPYRSLPRRATPSSTWLYEHGLNIPSSVGLTDAQVDEVIDAIRGGGGATRVAAVAPKPLARPRPATIAIGARRIGPGQPAFVIAEAGVNHDQDLAEAHRLVDAAASAGADAVKFQTWQTELLCRPGARKADYQVANDAASSDQFSMLKRLELPYAWHRELKAHAESVGLVFLSTPDEIVSARFLADLGVPAIKIGSAEVDNLPYLAELARLGLPLLLSTGMSDLAEVARALDCFAANGDPPVALFHAVSAYPAPLEDMNVRAVATLRATFGVPAGLSDHCPSVEPVLAAVGLGLDLWEKHLTCDRKRPGPDHSASLEPAELARQVAAVRAAERALGDGRKGARPSELGTIPVVRRRIHAARALEAGRGLEATDMTALRGESGIAVSSWSDVLGRRLRVARGALEPIEPAHLEPRA